MTGMPSLKELVEHDSSEFDNCFRLSLEQNG
jgi:hypothetical protein